MISLSHWGMHGTEANEFADFTIKDVFEGCGRILRLADILGLHTIGQLAAICRAELLRIPNFGRTSLRLLDEMIEPFKLSRELRPLSPVEWDRIDGRPHC